MAENPRSQLERAYSLIQQEQMYEALGILEPLLAKDPNNIDAWWLMANAVSEPQAARRALDNVLRLDPNRADARHLLDELNAAVSEPVSVGATDLGFEDFTTDDPFAGLRSTETDASEPVAASGALADDSIPSFIRESVKPSGKPPRDFTVGDEEALEAALGTAGSGMGPNARTTAPTPSRQPAPRPGRLLLGLLAALVIILVLVVVLVVLPGANQKTTLTNTAVAAVPTISASTTAAATVESVVSTASVTSAPSPSSLPSAPTQAATQGSSASISLDSVAAALLTQFSSNSAFSTTHNPQAAIKSSSLGQTLTLSFCSPFGPKLTQTINSAMDLLATQAAPVSTQLQAISAEVYSCADNTQLLLKKVSPIADVVAYINKTIDVHKFRAGWQNQ